MAHYRRGWEAGLENLETWWASSTEYVQSSGCCRLPEGYRKLTDSVTKFAREKARIDDTPLRRLGLLIEHHAELPPAISRLPIHVSNDELWLAAEFACSAKDKIFAAGIAEKRTGRKVDRETERVRKMLADDLSVDAITKRTGKSAGNVRTIRSRMKRDSG